MNLKRQARMTTAAPFSILLFIFFLSWASLPHMILSVSAIPLDTKDGMRAGVGYRDKVFTSTMRAPLSSVDGLMDGAEALPKPTRKPYNCSETHRSHRNDSNKFQVRHNKVWWDQVCQTGLVWNQTLCRCEYLRETLGYSATIMDCPDYREHGNLSGKYEQKVNGVWLTRDCNLAVAGLVWNQTACRCVWGPDGDVSQLNFERSTPCDTMLNVTFDNGLVDEAKSSFMELTSGSSLALRSYGLRSGDKSGDIRPNKAAYFQDATMTVWYFAGNEMSGSLRVEFRFKAEDNPLTRDRYQILLSNGCNVTGLGYTTPSLAIGYRAGDRSFLLALHTTNVRKAIVCTRDLEPYAWHQVSLIYEDGTLLFRVNNHPCIISNDFSGDVQKTPCPLTIGSDPLEKESKYMGYLDDLMVARYCRRFVEQALVPEAQDKEDATDNYVVNSHDKLPSINRPAADEKRHHSKDDDNEDDDDGNGNDFAPQTAYTSDDGDVDDMEFRMEDKIQPYRASMKALL